MKNSILLSGLFLILFSQVLFAQTQVNQFHFTQSVETYQEITGGTVLSTGGTNNVSYFTQLGFTFNTTTFGSFTQCMVNTNGWIAFGDGSSPSTIFPISNTTDNVLFYIAGFASQIQGGFVTTGSITAGSNVVTNIFSTAGLKTGNIIFGTGIPASTTITSVDEVNSSITISNNATQNNSEVQLTSGAPEIRTELFGEAPNRYRVFQFKDFRRKTNFGAPTQHLHTYFNFQIIIYETSNNIEFHYGEISYKNSAGTNVQVGLRGAWSDYSFYARRTTGDWANSQRSFTRTIMMDLNDSSNVPTGLKYHLRAPRQYDLAIQSVHPPNYWHVLFPPNMIQSVTIVNTGYTTLTESRGVFFQYSTDNGVTWSAASPAVTSNISLSPGAAQSLQLTGSAMVNPPFNGPILVRFRVSSILTNNHGYPEDDTVTMTYLAGQVDQYPYVQNFDFPVYGFNNYYEFSNESGHILAVNPAGDEDDPVLWFKKFSSGTFQSQTTPIFNPPHTTNIVSFYVSHRTRTTQNDNLKLLISTNSGTNWHGTIYDKSFNDSPSLSTLPPSTDEWFPNGTPGEWRHEMITIPGTYFAQQNVRFRFEASGNGNNIFVDNFRVLQYNFTAGDRIATFNVAAPGAYGNLATNSVQVMVDFTAIRQAGSNREIITDNPESGGDLQVLKKNSFPENNNFLPNSTATTFSGAIFTPDVVADKYWEISYSGDYNSNPTYDITLDISNQLGIVDPDRLYIMKRTDESSPWECLPTVTIYDEFENPSRLVSSGLQGFSQFGIGAEDGTLPVDLISFNATVEDRDVNLNWTTAWEENNMRFDVQRRIAETDASWATVGSVAGSGTINELKSYSFLDKNLVTGMYEYRLVQIDFDGNSTADHSLENTVEIGIPTTFELSQNYPNPFNPVTKIGFQIPVESFVKLSVFDITGREVATLVNDKINPGYHSVEFNAAGFASGVYFYRLSTKNNVITKKLMLLK